VGPLLGAGIGLSAIFGWTAVVAAAMALLAAIVARRRPAPARHAEHGRGDPAVAAPGAGAARDRGQRG
jgi:hypothetical protein